MLVLVQPWVRHFGFGFFYLIKSSKWRTGSSSTSYYKYPTGLLASFTCNFVSFQLVWATVRFLSLRFFVYNLFNDTHERFDVFFKSIVPQPLQLDYIQIVFFEVG